MLWRLTAIAAIVSLASAAISAQSAASSLTGRVTSNGAPLAGATIALTSPSLLGTRTAVTGADGWYFFRGLPPGPYDVVFTAAGRQTLIRRVELNVAETSRLDGELATSEDAETVTRTTLMPTLLETPQLATTIEAATADRLPIGRSLPERAVLAPGSGDMLSLVDGIVLSDTVAEAVDETTFITGGASAEYAEPEVMTTVTRRGGNALAGSLRATISSGERRLFEFAAGGAPMEDRLWFFAGGADGEVRTEEQRRAVARIIGAPTEQHELELMHHTAHPAPPGITAARYTGTPTPSLTLEGLASAEQWSARGHLFLSTAAAGSHSVVAGAEDLGEAARPAFFVNDVWHGTPHWVLNLGIRRHEDGSDPRLGAVYDFRGDGEHRLGATWGRYDEIDEATLTYGWRFGVGGYARADYIRRSAGQTSDTVQIHGVYDVFRLFRFGGNHTRQIGGGEDFPSRTNVWIWYEPRLTDGRLTLAFLQRHDDVWSTDLSSTYAFLTAGVTAFAKVDVVDAFADRDWRASVGVRF